MQIWSRISKTKDFGLKQLGTGFKVQAAHAHQKLWELAPPTPHDLHRVLKPLRVYGKKNKTCYRPFHWLPLWKGKRIAEKKFKDDKILNNG